MVLTAGTEKNVPCERYTLIVKISPWTAQGSS